MKSSGRRWLGTLLCIALLVGVLSGCGDRSSNNASSDTSSPSQGSSSSSAIDEGEPMDGEGAQKVVRTFMDALKNGDEAAITQITSSMEGVYSGWAKTKFERITAKTLSESADLSTYLLTFEVSESGDPFFPVGTYQRIVGVGYPYFGDYGVVSILMPDEPFFYEQSPADETKAGFKAYQQVSGYINLMETILFKDTSEIPLNEVVDYALIQCSQEYPEKYYYTQGDVQAMVERCFGLPYFDGTASKFYDPENDQYELWGRGGSIRNMRTREVAYDAASKTYTINVDFYSDILCTRKSQRVVYQLGENADGSLRFISGIAQ